MFCANFQNNIIQLSELPRNQFQQIYDAGRSGKLTCPLCQKEVRLYIGLKQSPHFYHAGKGDYSDCVEYCSTLQIEPASAVTEKEAVHSGSFRLPQGRSIKDEPAETQGFTPATPVTISNVYTDQAELQSNTLFPGISFNSSQYEAITNVEGPMLVLSGAGSGKTRVLTARAAYMAVHRKIDPRSIMLVTFTSKAAKEMRDRLSQSYGMMPQQLAGIVVGTFHSIFYRMLAHYDGAKWNGNNLIKGEWQREQYIKTAGREKGLDEKDFPYDLALQKISYWKNTLSISSSFKPKDDWEEQVFYLYQRYEEMKRDRNQFDFDDMLIGCYDLLTENKELLERYQKRFTHFLIDEFQDINTVQYQLMKLLSEHTRHICAVGDDDQSIYSFRGSDPGFILNFQKDFPDAAVIQLTKNYRSSHPIVASAKKVIVRNRNRLNKNIQSSFNHEQQPLFFYPYDEEEEATMIVNDIKERIQEGEDPGSFAVLYRTHSAGRAVFERLYQSSLPFSMEKETAGFYDRRVVKTAAAYLTLSRDPDSVEAVTSLLFAFFIKQTALSDLKAISILEDCSLLEALLKLPQLQPFQKKKIQQILPRFARLRSMKPVEALITIEKDMGLGDYLKKRGSEGNSIEKGSDDLQDLKVAAKEFQTVDAFLDHIDHMKHAVKEINSLQRSPENSIQLMTIHRSKGLEFKHVYVLGVTDGSLPHDFALDSHRQGDSSHLEEERRLLYVAMTRAKEGLYLSLPSYRRYKKAVPSRFIKHLM
ncbi:AAA family ATPase [Bacillus lacus]|uniref:DNA 3'-5' helicase n=1 Tax=Metabacillus lacus TaxID=1983721 RepID=A0A7X2LWW4_9BACI|nr:ATP-dependent helicase [Metabacillus lacus]MRX71915.1 AAA family ATPase [Metabacillus lacus]